jgi:hypothetical protein
MHCCGNTLLTLQSPRLWDRLLKRGPRRLRDRRNVLTPLYQKMTTRSVSRAQNAMSPSTHESYRGDSNAKVLRFYSTHALGRKIPDSALGDRRLGKTRKWTANILTRWLHEVTSAMREHPPVRFQLNLALLTQGSSDSRLQRRRDAT